ncbi:MULTISPECIES: hypothetical protein [Halobacterium]|uniref:hypothetical protein n=1 Tax=Halobacterium TaxID=2239 RepID=UPI00073E159C|nr:MULTISPECIES: hypothetical protein [Halobacterium]MCG1003093.1 hypothetical protein [Halobacterium noricense]
MRRVVAVLAVVLLATQAVGAAAVQGPVDADAQPSNVHVATEPARGTVDDATVQTSTIRKDIDLHLTPSEPGAIDVVVTYDVPDAVTALRTTLPSGAEHVESDSFTRTPDDYEWDGTTDPATIRFTLPANQTASGSRGPSVQASGDYSFVDTGEWALVTVPQLRTGWNYRGRRGR